MSERTIDIAPTSEPSAAVKQLERQLSATPRTLWGDAWRRFLRHKLALIGAHDADLIYRCRRSRPTASIKSDPEALDFNALCRHHRPHAPVRHRRPRARYAGPLDVRRPDFASVGLSR